MHGVISDAVSIYFGHAMGRRFRRPAVASQFGPLARPCLLKHTMEVSTGGRWCYGPTNRAAAFIPLPLSVDQRPTGNLAKSAVWLLYLQTKSARGRVSIACRNTRWLSGRGLWYHKNRKLA